MSWPRSTRPDLEPYEDGTRLDVLESPLGPPPGALDALLRAAGTLHRSPRGLRRDVVDRVARYCGTGFSSIVLTAGLEEAVDLLLADVDCLWLPHPGDDRLALRAQAAGKAARRIPLDERWQPLLDPVAVGPRGLVVLDQPHDPTGNLFARDWVEAVARSAERTCIDETDLAVAAAPSYVGLASSLRDVCVYRDLSRALGLGGVRLGALVAPVALAARLRARQAAGDSDSVALHLVAGALDDRRYQHELVTYLREARPAFLEVLAGCPAFAEVRDTAASYVLGRCPEPGHAAALVRRLAEHDVYVRDCAAMGLPGWVRVSVGSPADRGRLEAALAAVAARTDGDGPGLTGMRGGLP